jgi:LAO/AO transport system kinase
VTLPERFRAGDVRALARLISLAEDDDPAIEPLLASLDSQVPAARVIGITGPPGAGKSTLAGALVGVWRGQNRRVAVLAIDPSSARTGGAALGDRLRMTGHHADPGVYIRSMATRGQRGGLATATSRVVALLAAFGFDDILVETVGVGQADTDIAHLAHVVVVVQVPGLGDEVQAIKAGLLEEADIIAVNKADLPGAATIAAQLRALAVPPDRQPPPVIVVSAATGAGVADLAAAIDAAAQAASGRTLSPARARVRLLDAALTRLRHRLAASPQLADLSRQVAADHLTIEQAVARLLDEPPA